MKRSLFSSRGFSLIELSIVLGVFAVVAGAIWLVVSVVMENLRQYDANQKLQQMVQNIRQLESRITHFSTAAGTNITADLDNQGAFPLQMRLNANGSTPGNLNNPWTTAGNSVSVFIRSATSFGIQLAKVPKKSCATLATKLGTGEIRGLVSVQVNTAAPFSPANNNFPVSLIGATAACNSATANTLEWVFNLQAE